MNDVAPSLPGVRSRRGRGIGILMEVKGVVVDFGSVC